MKNILKENFHITIILMKVRKLNFLIVSGGLSGSKNLQEKGIEVTEEIRVMIAASAVQLTFGLENFKLDYFDRIVIYPEPYYSPATGQYHKGEANQKGIIVLSWKDFLKGYEISDDTFNVGLHEMAHALDLENRIIGADEYLKTNFNKWKQVATPAYVMVRDEYDSIFRKYGGTNFTEFFAVSVEHFFERSQEFREALPDVYQSMCLLLNQDPLRKRDPVTA